MPYPTKKLWEITEEFGDIDKLKDAYYELQESLYVK